jgi:predicted nucleic acid-binding protein
LIVLDTSGLPIAINSSQRFHHAARALLHEGTVPLILTPFVLAELNYLLATRVSNDAGLALLEEVVGGYTLTQF